MATRLWGVVLVMSLPRNRMVPLWGFLSPDRVSSVVVLPAPLAPMRVMISPSSTEKDTSFRARMLS